MMRSRPPWKDLSTGAKATTVALAVIQISLAAGAWIDLARRPQAEVNGPKKLWSAVIGINYVGPIVYFWRGRRR